MKKISNSLFVLFTVSILVLGTTAAHCDRGTEYSNSRGGKAYVGPNGAAVQGANGNSAAKSKNGTTATGQKNSNGSTTYNTSNGGKAYVGPNGAAAKGANGNSAAVTKNGYATSSNGNNSYHGSSTTVKVNTVHYNSSYPHGYYNTVPVGYSRVNYGGYNCYYVGGIYYRSVVYQGATIYIVVR